MNKRLFILLAFILLMCTGCNNNAEKEVRYPVLSGSDSIILHNRIEQSLIAYDTKTYKDYSETNIPNFCIYEFNAPSNYYTAGHSLNGDFEIIQIKGDELKTVYTMPGNESITPLTCNNKYLFFFIQSEKDNTQKHRVALLDSKNKTLINYKNIKGFVESGAIFKDRLYYTVYNEKKDIYNLYSTPCKKSNSKPKLEKRNLKYGDVYSSDTEVYVSDEKNILSLSGNKKIQKGMLNYFSDNLVIQYHKDDSLEKPFTITDLNNRKVIYQTDDVTDFKVTKDKIIIYKSNGIEYI